jgi:hypothetical protein
MSDDMTHHADFHRRSRVLRLAALERAPGRGSLTIWRTITIERPAPNLARLAWLERPDPDSARED